MSNPEKKPMNAAKEISENSDNNDSSRSIEAGETREEVLALPALSVSQGPAVSDNIHKEAINAARLIVKAAKEAVEKKKTEQTMSVTGDGSPEIKKSKRPLDEESGSGEVRKMMKKPCRKGSSHQLTNLPPGNSKSICPICWKRFKSPNAVYGHMRLHKDRGSYQGSLPRLTLYAAEEGLGKVIGSSSSGGGLGIDLNVKLEEDDEEEGSARGSEFAWKFDLNKEPQDEEDKGKEDKAK